MVFLSFLSWFCNVKYILWLFILISCMYIMIDVNYILLLWRFYLYYCIWMMDIDKLSYKYMYIYKMGLVWLYVFIVERII